MSTKGCGAWRGGKRGQRTAPRESGVQYYTLYLFCLMLSALGYFDMSTQYAVVEVTDHTQNFHWINSGWT